MKPFKITIPNSDEHIYECVNTAIKVEVFLGGDRYPCTIKHYKHFREWRLTDGGWGRVEALQDDFSGWLGFPTGERLSEVFVNNKQKSFERLYLDSKGNIITRFVFTKEN